MIKCAFCGCFGGHFFDCLEVAWEKDGALEIAAARIRVEQRTALLRDRERLIDEARD